MRSPFAYTPRGGPLDDADALAATIFLGSFAFVAFAYSNPIVLAGAAAAVVVAGRAAGAGRALAAALRWGIWLGVVFVVVNAITAQRGDTILIRGFDAPILGQIDVSAEALAEGAVLALRVVVVLMAFAVQSASVDPNRLLRLLRPVARHSALTATLITRMVPLAAADHARLREAAALRGPAAAPVGRAVMARRLVAGSLDRAIDVAATLELRGYAHGAPRGAGSLHRSRYSWRFLATGITVIAASIAIRVAGGGGFDPYPLVSLDASAATWTLALALPLLAALPFAGTRRSRR
jgi:energy-coupling factor transport system permease protein